MAAKRPSAKAPAKAGAIEESASDAEERKWEFLTELGQRGGHDYLLALCNAIDSEEAIPSAALRHLATALREFQSKDAPSVQLTKFATALSLKGKRGRPRKDDAKFMRAANYWLLRLWNDDGEARTDGEAIAILEEFVNETQIRRAVKEYPSAQDFVRAYLAKEDGGK